MKHVTALLLMLCSTGVIADYCEESKIIELDFDASQYQEVELKALAGELDIEPAKNDQINFWGKVCTDEAKHLDMIDLVVTEEDGKLSLITQIPYFDSDFDPSYAIMDIEFSLPESMPLTLHDSSGDMQVEGVSVISIEDSSGNIRVLDTKENLSIRDSSGNIYVRGLEGNVTVSDSSGNIDLNDITGDVDIPGDSSGDIEISDVEGKVNIDRDSSGDIEIDHVGKDVLIGSDGSGDISIEDVKGMVQITADGSGTVMVEEVAGDFLLENKGSGDIRTADIDGSVDVPR